MSELIDRIPGQESALAQLREVVETTEQIKARQRITGRSGQLGYAVASAATWDYTETFPTTSGGGYVGAGYRITFTSDGTQDYPIVVPSVDIRVNGTDEANRLKIIPSSGLYQYSDGSGEVLMQIYERPYEGLFGSKNQSAWDYVFLYRGSVTIRIKPRGQASSKGTFSVARTS